VSNPLKDSLYDTIYQIAVTLFLLLYMKICCKFGKGDTPVKSVFHFGEQLDLKALSAEEYEQLFLFCPHHK